MIPFQMADAWRRNNGFAEMANINNGSCENFAMAMENFIADGEIVGTDNFVEPFGKDWPGGHIWIFDGERHYDSEALEGVLEWRDLPFFKRLVC